jgi:hypothetical protein
MSPERETPGQVSGQTLPTAQLNRIRRARRSPRPTQFDYLHLRILRAAIARELAAIPLAPDVLDVFCGTRPYEDLLPADSRCIGMDISDRYGAPDVISDEFLPFEDQSFDLVVPALAALFEDWRDVRVIENGGHGVVWATQTGYVINLFHDEGLRARVRFLSVALGPLFAAAFGLINLAGAAIERRLATRPTILPMNLTLIARRP